MRWVLVGIIGVITGTVAFLISIADKYLTQFKLNVFESVRTVHAHSLKFWNYILCNNLFQIMLQRMVSFMAF